MILKRLFAAIAIVAIVSFLFSPAGLIAENPTYVPDKALCAKMLAAGKEAYSRGRYLDAKNFFRKAVEADYTSRKAWRYYDQTVIFALAEKAEKVNDYLVPDASIRAEAGGGVSHGAALPAPVVPIETESAGEEEWEPMEEEGC